MKDELSISLPVEVLLPHVLPVVQRTLETWLEDQPKPDQQYTAEQVSHILNVDVQTVHSYTRLEVGHPRRLPYVVTHDSAKGKRFLLSEVTLWQRRNGCDALREPPKPTGSKRPLRRRAS